MQLIADFFADIDRRWPREPAAYVAHLHRVERDMLGVAESTIDLPSWI